MTTNIVTPSMRAHADILLSEPRWSEGVRNRDGRPVFLFAARTTGAVVYFTDSAACSCPSFAHRGLCAHVVAVSERAAEADIEAAFASVAFRRR